MVKTRGDLDNRGGQVVGLNELQVQAAALDNRSAGLLSSKGDMDIEFARLDNSAGGKLVSERRTLLKADRLDNRSGRIVAGQDLDLSSRLIDNRAGDISSTSRVVASAREQLDNRGGKIVGDSGLDITTPRMLNQDKGVLASRDGLRLSAAWADYRGEARLSLCAIFALAAVITPLLVLFGLKYGLVSTLTERLERAPSVREIIPVGGARYRAEDIAALAARADVAFAVPRTRQIAATADLSGGGETALSVEMIPSAAGDPLLAGLPQPDRPTRVVLSHGAAEKLGVQPGERIVARIGRRMDGQEPSGQRLPFAPQQRLDQAEVPVAPGVRDRRLYRAEGLSPAYRRLAARPLQP